MPMGGHSESPIGWMDFTEHGPRHLSGGSQATAALWLGMPGHIAVGAAVTRSSGTSGKESTWANAIAYLGLAVRVQRLSAAKGRSFATKR
jgi:hypothetical protein